MTMHWKQTKAKRRLRYSGSLIETKPTTLAGLSAFFSYLLTTYYVQDDSYMDGTVNTIFETTAEALKELSANVGQS
jgi:hypothetical protein